MSHSGPWQPGAMARFGNLRRSSRPKSPAPRARPAPVDVPAAVPPVVAVVVAHDPGAWFEEVARQPGGADLSDLSVLIIDAASAEDLTPRIAGPCPRAFVRRLPDNPGFGAPRTRRRTGRGGVVLPAVSRRRGVRTRRGASAGGGGVPLQRRHRGTEARRLERPDAAPAGRHERRQGSVSAVPIAERGELDQEQHDDVRDVFVVPGGCTLIRADLFDRSAGSTKRSTTWARTSTSAGGAMSPGPGPHRSRGPGATPGGARPSARRPTTSAGAGRGIGCGPFSATTPHGSCCASCRWRC